VITSTLVPTHVLSSMFRLVKGIRPSMTQQRSLDFFLKDMDIVREEKLAI